MLRYNWVVDLDIKGFFDNIDHELLMRAIRKHTDNKWLLLHIERTLFLAWGRLTDVRECARIQPI